MKPLLVGLNNPISRDLDDALVTFPTGCSGHMLLRTIQKADPDFTEADYYARFFRMNLWPGRQMPRGYGSGAALREAGQLVLERAKGFEDVVLFGVKVWDSVMACKAPPFFDHRTLNGTTFWYLPHPSGVNRFLNAGDNRERAGKILRELAGTP